MDMMTFNQYFTPQAMAAYWEEVYSNQINYLGPAFFGRQQKMGLDLKWIRGKSKVNLSLMPSTYDALPKFRGHEGFSITETEMPFFREAHLIKEKDRQEIIRAQSSNDPYLQEIITRTFDEVAQLIEGSRIIPERMIWQLLAPATGSPGISIVENGVEYVYNYDETGDWKTNNYSELTGTDVWSDAANSKPLDDIQQILTKAQNRNGGKISVLVMTTKTFNQLVSNAQIRSAILAQNSTANIFMTSNLVKSTIANFLGVSIVTYDKTYMANDGTETPYLADNVVVYLPSGQVGTVWKGTTPEAADLMGSGEASVSVVDGGTTISRILKPLPVNVEIWVSEVVLPSYERMDDVYVMKVG